MKGYEKYIERFTKIAGEKRIIDVSHLSTGKELCNLNQPCKFYIFVYEPEKEIERTVLFTSGIHGN